MVDLPHREDEKLLRSNTEKAELLSSYLTSISSQKQKRAPPATSRIKEGNGRTADRKR